MSCVDIVIPLYNKASTIQRAIQSIQHQDISDWRLFVVDDGSIDGGAAIVEGIRDDRVVLLRQTNRGPGEARNAGLARVEAEYVAFLDGDDEWYPWYLSNALAAMRQRDCALVASLYYQWPQQWDMTRHYAQKGIMPGLYQFQGNEDPVWASEILSLVSSWNCLARTDVIRRFGGFYGENRCMWGEDQTLFIRVLLNESFSIIRPPSVRYHTETSSFVREANSGANRYHPLEPYLLDTKLVMDFCPQEKQLLLSKILDLRALGTATVWAYHGKGREADELLKKYSGAKQFKRHYRTYLWYGKIRPVWWTKLKCLVGPIIKRWIRLFLKVQPTAPLMPWEMSKK